MAARMNLLAVGMDAQVLAEDVEVVRSLKGKPIPEGSSLGAEYVKALYTRAAMQQRPMPKPTPEAIGLWGGEIFEIGRASCRERVAVRVDPGGRRIITNKNKNEHYNKRQK